MAGEDSHDWETIARKDPYFGVLSAPEFRSERMTEDARLRFYASGDADIAGILSWFDQDIGARPVEGRALDIGCGVGRLVCAMAKVMPAVSGYDISKTMVEIARRAAPANADISTVLPVGPFAWINSYIVFQHIPPEAGLDLLETTLSMSGPGCFLSLHITAWRDLPLPKTHIFARIYHGLMHEIDRRSGKVDRLIRMHDYNLSDVMRRVVKAGFSHVALRHTEHGGHHGVWIIARRDQGRD